MPQTETTSNKNYTQKSSDGYSVGQAATDLVTFYGGTPIVQPSAAAQASVTDSSGGAASATTGVQALTSTYNSTLISNSIATILAQTNAMRTALVNLGLMKGSA